MTNRAHEQLGPGVARLFFSVERLQKNSTDRNRITNQ